MAAKKEFQMKNKRIQLKDRAARRENFSRSWFGVELMCLMLSKGELHHLYHIYLRTITRKWFFSPNTSSSLLFRWWTKHNRYHKVQLLLPTIKCDLFLFFKYFCQNEHFFLQFTKLTSKIRRFNLIRNCRANGNFISWMTKWKLCTKIYFARFFL